MRISRIAVTNHSRVRDLDLEVRRHAVIVGANDVGKSSILRVLHLAIGSSTAGLYQSLTLNDLRDTEQPLVVDVTWTDFNDQDREPFPAEISVSEDQESESPWVQMTVEAHCDVSGHRRHPNPRNVGSGVRHFGVRGW